MRKGYQGGKEMSTGGSTLNKSMEKQERLFRVTLNNSIRFSKSIKNMKEMKVE